MIRTAFFTLGLAGTVISAGWGALSFLAYARSDAPMQNTADVLALPGIGAAIGAAVMLGAWLA